jgi:arylsulfatase A-like enzyme
MVGKWHLEPNHTQKHWLEATIPAEHAKNLGKNVNIPEDIKHQYQPGQRGFTEFFNGRSRSYQANYDLDGNSLAAGGEQVINEGYRLDVQTKAAAAFIERNHQNPFFLYLAYYGPHVPLEATEKYLERFPGDMPQRRRVALAMISAIDDGVGRITRLLEEKGIDDNTLIFFISDNGAPIKKHYEDQPLSYVGGWDGSMNTPWVGEKGMLSEGGIRVPYVVSWKGTLPEGKVYDAPVSTLDIGATALALAGVESDVELDGVNIIPYLTGEKTGVPHDTLYWRFWSQLAVREGKYKYLKLIGNEEYLFDLEADGHETKNLLAEKPALAARLAKKLDSWNSALPANRSIGARIAGEEDWFDFYFKVEADQE